MPVQFKDYYQSLGVTKTASADDIRKAFRKLARLHHPDVAKDKKSAEEKFKEINEAYEVLGDPEKRKKYDELGADWDRPGGFQPPPGWNQQRGGTRGGGGEEFEFDGTGFSDFFEAFFGARGGGTQHPFGGAHAHRGAEKGNDIEADIMVTLEEALHGSQRRVSFRRAKNANTETYNVRIPPGVHEHQRIRLAGQGEAGARGGSAGDLFLRVKFAQHPEFSVQGADLIHEMQIPPWDAVLGTECKVPTIEGEVRLKIPAGTQNHQRFRLRERGLPKSKTERGDMYVVIDVELPKTLTPAQRELWEKLSQIG